MSENPKTVVAFLKLLAKQLYEPLLRERSENLHISRELKSGIFRVLNLTSSETPAYNQGVLPRNQRKYCSICDPKLKRKTVSRPTILLKLKNGGREVCDTILQWFPVLLRGKSRGFVGLANTWLGDDNLFEERNKKNHIFKQAMRQFTSYIGNLIAACPTLDYGWLYTKNFEMNKLEP
nr:unnamed protein product [Callosobruchus chinensis]